MLLDWATSQACGAVRPSLLIHEDDHGDMDGGQGSMMADLASFLLVILSMLVVAAVISAVVLLVYGLWKRR